MRFGSILSASTNLFSPRSINQHEAVQERAAELACLAAIHLRQKNDAASKDAANELAAKISNGRAAWRRGACNVFAKNFDIAPLTDFCVLHLERFLDDEDETVRRTISRVFFDLPEDLFWRLRDFVAKFAASPALADGCEEFIECLWRFGTLDPVWTLQTIKSVLDSNYNQTEEFRYLSIDKLIRTVLLVNVHPLTDSRLKSEAMDLWRRQSIRRIGRDRA